MGMIFAEEGGQVFALPVDTEEAHLLDLTHVAVMTRDGETAVVESMGTVVSDGLDVEQSGERGSE